jgi:hypothetical protein
MSDKENNVVVSTPGQSCCHQFSEGEKLGAIWKLTTQEFLRNGDNLNDLQFDRNFAVLRRPDGQEIVICQA